jgi:NAD+ synthase (glutamine-hydrolysing)
VRLALAQVNSTVGALEANAELVIERMEAARVAGADLVAFPELVIAGYPPEDLLLKDHFLAGCWRALARVAAASEGLCALVGVPIAEGRAVYNAAAVLAGGRVAGVYHKICLPNYAVFDEKRYFTPGDHAGIVDLGGVHVGVNVCEDIWEPCGPTEAVARDGDAALVVNLSMSPYHVGKGKEREAMLSRRARDARAYVGYVNGVGGQDELVFDGHSLVFGPDGALIARALQFEEDLLVVDLEVTVPKATAYEPPGSAEPASECGPSPWGIDIITVETAGGADRSGQPAAPRPARRPPTSAPPSCRVSPCLDEEAEIYAALRLGVADYVRKNRFERVVMGISGGIDSALTACIASDALGKERVTAVSMPSRHSSAGTRDDARETSERLGVGFYEIPIESIYHSYLKTLEPYFADTSSGVTEQNIQARIRGNLLMALSNKFGWLVLTTGNKSETAVGYATLYGDMAGGFAVLKDVPKTLVYRLSAYRNSLGPGDGPIPRATMERAPSAELADDQTDQDTLPPYELLDRIIEAYVVADDSLEEIVASGVDRTEAQRVIAMIDGNEYKRRQAAPGVRITPKAFGKDRRLPITNRFRG